MPLSWPYLSYTHESIHLNFKFSYSFITNVICGEPLKKNSIKIT